MKRFLHLVILLILPGGIILLAFRLIRHFRQNISEFFTRLKQKILS